MRTLVTVLVVGGSHAGESLAHPIWPVSNPGMAGNHAGGDLAKGPELEVMPVEVREISDLGATITIPVNPAFDTYIEFPRDIRDTNSPQSRPFFKVDHRHELLRIRLDENAAVFSKGSVYVDTASGRHSLLLKVVRYPEDAVPGLVLTLGSDNKLIRAELAAREADIKARYDELEHERSAELERYGARIAAARVMSGEGYLVPAVRRVSDGITADVRVSIDGGLWDNQELITSFVLENARMQPYRAAAIWAVDADGRKSRAELVAVGSPAQPEEGIIAWIPPGKRARMVIAIPDAARGRFTSMQIHISEPHGLNAVMGEAEHWYEWSPLFKPATPEQMEEKRREEEARGRVSVHLQAIVGAIWLTDGMGGSQPDAATLTGLGVRGTYSVNRLFAFEAGVMGAKTGEASFADRTVGGMQGELARSASLGRVQLGGVVRLGYRIIPTMRLGVGLQGAGYDTELMAAGGHVPGPESGLEINGLWYFGGGVDIRLGRYLSAGIAGSFEQLVSSEVRSVGAGIHLGYSWNP
jgi:hypothetical protein